jgi:hypothetical protein
MKSDTLLYYRQRERAECEAALNASCPEARRAHAEMAKAYAHLVEIAELEERGELPPGKVASMTEAMHQGDEAEYAPARPRRRGPATEQD